MLRQLAVFQEAAQTEVNIASLEHNCSPSLPTEGIFSYELQYQRADVAITFLIVCSLSNWSSVFTCFHGLPIHGLWLPPDSLSQLALNYVVRSFNAHP